MSGAEPLPAELRVAADGSPEHAAMIQMVEWLRAASVVALGESTDPNKIALMMTAACTYAGTLFGTLIIAGIATDQDRKRVTDSMARNFRSGIDVGKRRALRIATEQFGGQA